MTSSDGMCTRCQQNAALPTSVYCRDCEDMLDEALSKPVDPEWAQDYQCDRAGCTRQAQGWLVGVGQFCIDHLAEEAEATPA